MFMDVSKDARLTVRMRNASQNNEVLDREMQEDELRALEKALG